MTEVEWLTCEDPALMFAHLGAAASERKLRLLAVACVGGCVSDVCTRALALAERFADGRASGEDLAAARAAAEADVRGARYDLSDRHGEGAAAVDRAGCLAAGDSAAELIQAIDLAAEREPIAPAYFAERRRQAPLVREVFGNPFRPARVDRAWLTPTVVSLARTVDDERAFDRLPILADALEDAGCTDAAILGHCRGPGPHVRGCWVVDLILGKQ
jgi:hypothetical protein